MPAAPAVPPLAGSDVSSICSYLESTNALKEADDLAAGNGDMNKISRVPAEMQQVAANPPPYLQLITGNIVSGLETLSAGGKATQTVLADSRLLAGFGNLRQPLPDRLPHERHIVLSSATVCWLVTEQSAPGEARHRGPPGRDGPAYVRPTHMNPGRFAAGMEM